MSKKLRLKFGLASEGTRYITLPNPKTGLDAAGVQSCMTAMVESGGAFADALTSALRAEVVETNTTVLVDNE